MVKKSEPSKDKEASGDREEADENLIPWSGFLTSYPPDSFAKIGDVTARRRVPGGYIEVVATPEIDLFCETCDGVRRFICEDEEFERLEKASKPYHGYLRYVCKNCESVEKLYALIVYRREKGVGAAIKLGEWPPFEQARTPRRLRKILGEKDWNYFRKGQKSENNALGLGAFTYYRRVLDRQWDELLAEIIKVAETTNADPEIVNQLKEAQEEKLFARSLEKAKGAIPPVLLIGGNNPLLALHKALSIHIHEKDDGECLQIANDIQIVLGDLAERIGEALKRKTHVQQALGRLQRVKQEG